MEIKLEFYFVISFLLQHFTKNAESLLIVKPDTSEAVIGEKAIFNCSTNGKSDGIQWFHYPKTNPDRQIVYGFNQIYDAYRRFRIEMNNNTGALNLINPSVASTDAGKYECQDEYGRGEKSFAELIVLMTTPVCQSDTDINKIVGENNCGIPPDKLLLSCIVQYSGNEPPVLNWKSAGEGNKDGVVLPPTVQSDRVMQNIGLFGDSLVNRSSYECFASRGSSPKSSCRLGDMTIISKSVSCQDSCQDSSNAVIALVIVFVVIPIVAGVTASLVHYFLVYRPNSKRKAEFANSVFGTKYIEAVFRATLLLLPFYVGIFAILAKYLIAQFQKRRQQKSTGEKTLSTNEQIPLRGEKTLSTNETFPLKCDEDVVEKNAHTETQITIPESNQTTSAADVKNEGPNKDQLSDRKESLDDKLKEEINQWKETHGKSITKGSGLDKAIEQLHLDKAKLNSKIQHIQSENEKLVKKIESENKKLVNKIQSENETLVKKTQQLRNENKALEKNVKELEQRLCQADTVDYSKKSVLVHKIITRENESEKAKEKLISGMAVLEKSLFISHENKTEIEVYDSATYMYVRQLRVPDIGSMGISDMASSVKSSSSPSSSKLSCLILIGQFNETKNCSGIRRIDTNGNILKHWPSGGNVGRLSVHESNVIVCLSDKLVINEFNEDGQLIHTVRLSPAVGFMNPWHAIKITSMHFIVSHGDIGDTLKRVCVVDLEGNILKECKELGKASSSSTLKVPFCLLQDSRRSILVVDREHQRVILLDSSLKWQQKLLDTNETGTKDKHQFPIRLSFDETGSRLFVAVNKLSSKVWKGAVLIFKVK